MAKKTFGNIIREKRKAAGKTLTMTAAHLSVSVPYLSDIELGRRNPLKPSDILLLADYLEIDRDELLSVATLERNSITIQSKRADLMQAAVGLARGDLSDDDVRRILEIIKAGSVAK